MKTNTMFYFPPVSSWITLLGASPTVNVDVNVGDYVELPDGDTYLVTKDMSSRYVLTTNVPAGAKVHEVKVCDPAQ